MLLPPSLAAARAAGLLPGSRRPASGPRCLGRNVFPSDTEEGVSANPAGPSRLLWDQSPASWLGRGPRACPWPGPPTSSRPPASSSSSVVSVADDENTLFSPKKSNKNLLLKKSTSWKKQRAGGPSRSETGGQHFRGRRTSVFVARALWPASSARDASCTYTRQPSGGLCEARAGGRRGRAGGPDRVPPERQAGGPCRAAWY